MSRDVRIAQESDYNDIWELTMQLWEAELKLDQIIDLSFLVGGKGKREVEEVISDSLCLVLDGPDGVIGFANGRPLNCEKYLASEIQLERIVVDKRHRGKGYGKLLLNALEGLCQIYGYSFIRLDVLSKNTSAIELYEKHDYIPYSATYRKPLSSSLEVEMNER